MRASRSSQKYISRRGPSYKQQPTDTSVVSVRLEAIGLTDNSLFERFPETDNIAAIDSGRSPTIKHEELVLNTLFPLPSATIR